MKKKKKKKKVNFSDEAGAPATSGAANDAVSADSTEAAADKKAAPEEAGGSLEVGAVACVWVTSRPALCSARRAARVPVIRRKARVPFFGVLASSSSRTWRDPLHSGTETTCVRGEA